MPSAFVDRWTVCVDFKPRKRYLCLQKFVPRKKTGDEIKFGSVECLLYTFHQLAHKVSSCESSVAT